MNRARQWATSAMVSLGAAGASMLSGCDIEGVTPNCSDAGECFTPPGNSSAGTGGATGGSAGANTGGNGGAAGNTGGNGGTAGGAGSSAAGGAAGSAGTSGSGGTAGAGGNAGSSAGTSGAAGSNDGGPNDATPLDAAPDRRAEAGLDTSPIFDVGSLLDVRADVLDGVDGTVP